MTDTRRCSISNNKFDAETSNRLCTEDSNAINNIIKGNTYFGPGAGSGTLDIDGNSVSDGNRFFDSDGGEWS